MKLKFYGTRGSYPVPGKNTIIYGGNTTCVSFTSEINGKTHRLIIDCGTGAVNLGKEIITNYFAGKENLDITILFTHLHPDHIQAFPFFAPNYFKECSIKLMGMKTLKKHVGIVLEQSMVPPTFPIEYKDLKSNRKHYELKDGQHFKIDNIFGVNVMQAYAPSHPQQGCLYYIITDLTSNKKVACIWDLESKLGGDKAVIKFAKGCDIMIHDTQYTAEEYGNDKVIVQGFGHSTYEMAIDNALQSCIKDKLICTHFNPAHSDNKLEAIQNKYLHNENTFKLILAKEGMEIEI